MPNQGPYPLTPVPAPRNRRAGSPFEITRAGGTVIVNADGSISILPIGGKLTPFNYGFLVESSGFALANGSNVDAPLDPSNVSQVFVYWTEGFVFDGSSFGFDSMVTPIDGRYLMKAWFQIQQDPTNDLYVLVHAQSSGPGTTTWNGLGPGTVFIPHGAGGLMFTVSVVDLVEVSAANGFGLRVYCEGGTPTVQDGTFSMQYVSGAVSF